MSKLTEIIKRAKLRVFLVDDHPLVRKGIADCIRDEPNMAVCGQASTAAEALPEIASQKPDVALVDITLPGRDGIELTKDIKTHSPQTQVLVLSMHDESLYALRALRAGAGGYLMKNASASTLIRAIRSVCEGQVVVSPAMKDQLLMRVVNNGKQSLLETLSDREIQVVRMYGEGKTRGQIATQLNLSVKTIETHRSNICQKLGLRNSTELLRYAMELVRSENQNPPAS
ncbi:MAG: response regulator transcription factor [Verrucomicrobia bacterium]|nr:response regulator transcription factor [Verrucomicrobiota bacterium]